jgi:hypothetical protein
MTNGESVIGSSLAVLAAATEVWVSCCAEAGGVAVMNAAAEGVPRSTK